MSICLLNLLIFIDCFLCNFYPCVLFESFSHVIKQESHVYLWSLGKIYLVYFFKFSNFQKSELGKFIPNFSLNMWLLVLIYFWFMMPGVNYVKYGCSSARTTPEVSLYQNLSLRKNINAVITQNRVIDGNLKRQIKNQTLCTWRLFLLT